MRTNFDTLKTLASYIINALTEKNFIEFHVENRESLIDSLATELGVSFATDEDIRDQAIEEVEEKMGEVTDDVTETEIFNHSRKEIIKSFNGENIAGLYLVESLHNISNRVFDYMMNCDQVDDVFGEDEEIKKYLVAKIRGFNQRKF